MSGRVPKIWLALVATVIFPAMIAYAGMLLYLTCKPETPHPGSVGSQADVATSGRRTPELDSNGRGSDRIETVEEFSA